MTITWRIGPLLSLTSLCSFAIALKRQLNSSSPFDTYLNQRDSLISYGVIRISPTTIRWRSPLHSHVH
jgi:hypothetical protein